MNVQHGTGREKIRDEAENVLAITTSAEVRGAMRRIIGALDYPDLDERGVFGPDYPKPGEWKCPDCDYITEDTGSNTPCSEIVGTALGFGFGVSGISDTMTGRIEP